MRWKLVEKFGYLLYFFSKWGHLELHLVEFRAVCSVLCAQGSLHIMVPRLNPGCSCTKQAPSQLYYLSASKSWFFQLSCRHRWLPWRLPDPTTMWGFSWPWYPLSTVICVNTVNMPDEKLPNALTPVSSGETTWSLIAQRRCSVGKPLVLPSMMMELNFKWDL